MEDKNDKYRKQLTMFHYNLAEHGIEIKTDEEYNSSLKDRDFEKITIGTNIRFTTRADELTEISRIYKKRTQMSVPSREDEDTHILKYYINEGRNAKTDPVIPASIEDIKKYNNFIAEIKSVPGLNNLERLVLASNNMHYNMSFSDVSNKEAATHGDKYPQEIYAPATIFTGAKKGVCFDNAVALCDIGNKLGIDISLVFGRLNPVALIKLAESGGDAEHPLHAWNRVEIYVPDSTSRIVRYKFDLDPTWHFGFNMLKPRKEVKIPFDYSTYANIHIPETLNG